MSSQRGLDEPLESADLRGGIELFKKLALAREQVAIWTRRLAAQPEIEIAAERVRISRILGGDVGFLAFGIRCDHPAERIDPAFDSPHFQPEIFRHRAWRRRLSRRGARRPRSWFMSNGATLVDAHRAAAAAATESNHQPATAHV